MNNKKLLFITFASILFGILILAATDDLGTAILSLQIMFWASIIDNSINEIGDRKK